MNHVLKRIVFSSIFILSQACTTTDSQTSKINEKEKRAATLTFSEQSVSVDAYWITTPAVEPEQRLRLEVRDLKSGQLVPAPSDLSVSVWMKTHSYGMVEPSVEPMKDKEGRAMLGIYEASNIFFLVPGQWEVRVYMGESKDAKPMQKFAVDLGQEKLNPINDPSSHMYKMMNPETGAMDHSKHGHHKMPKSEDGSKADPASPKK